MSGLTYPLVCFDLDGTLVDDTVYIWQTLHEGFRTDATARAQAHRDFFSGRITYKEWFEHDLALLKRAGANRRRIDALMDTLSPMAGAHRLLRSLRSKGHRLAIISGSLDVVVERLFAPELFAHVLVNRLFFDERGEIAGGAHTPYDLDGKAEGLRALARAEGLSPSQAVFVGDNDNDVWVAEAAGLAIAFNCKSDALRSVCDHEVTEKDLMLLADLIG